MSSYSRSVRSFCDDEEALYPRESGHYSGGSYETWSSPRSKPSNFSPRSPLANRPTIIKAPISPREDLRQRKHANRLSVSLADQKDTRYLNGMRGLAALAVFFCHLSYGTWDVGHVYASAATGERSTSTSVLQLPIIRLFYSGPPMVAIFFVISGYALSVKPIQLMRTGDLEGLMRTLSSSVFRRALRLFLPCFVSTLAVACMAQLGLYEMTEEFAYNMRGVSEDHPWTAPNVLEQLLDWLQNMSNFVNLFDWSIYTASIHYDRHLWTIPVEMRCSLALFLVHVLVVRMSPKLRLSTVAFLMIWGIYWDRCDLVPFLAGAALAELNLQTTFQRHEPDWADDRKGGNSDRMHSSWWRLVYSVIFVAGLYLASYPDLDGHLTPGYKTLTKMIPSRFTEKHRFWPNISAIMIVWSVGNISLLQYIFMTEPLQWLGAISFPLYILHGPIIHTFGYLVMNQIWTRMNIRNSEENLILGFSLAASFIVIITLWSSHIFLRIVDVRCIRFARLAEDVFFVS